MAVAVNAIKGTSNLKNFRVEELKFSRRIDKRLKFQSDDDSKFKKAKKVVC